ncbi:MAG TPA: hydroxymethylbilane synthase [bacterium]
MRVVVVGTRGSALALAQSRLIAEALGARHPNRRFELRTVESEGDRRAEEPLAAIGGEGVFVKELEHALLDGRIDVAVHSMKDLPLESPKGITLAAVPEREDPRDALVCRPGEGGLESLPAGARIGTSSLRRRGQLLRHRPDVRPAEIRGNVDTRLRKLDEGRYDAIVVAACGLARLGLEGRISARLPLDWMLPEPGQGALAVQVRGDDAEAGRVTAALDDAISRSRVRAERAFLGALGGGCRLPIAASARADGPRLVLDGAVCAADGTRLVRGSRTGSIADPDGLGRSLGEELIAQGALEMLRRV